MKTKIILLFLLLSINSYTKAQSSEALARHHFIEAQNAYGNGDNKTALTNLEATVEALGKTNSKIEALYTFVYYNKKDFIKVKSHMTKYFDIANEDHSDYMKMISLLTETNNKVKEEQKRQSDMGITDHSNFEEIASLGSDNNWVNKIELNNNNFISHEFEKAEKYKSIPGKARLAYFYLTGKGVEHNKEKAIALSLEGSKIKLPLASYIYAIAKYGWYGREDDFLNLLQVAVNEIDVAYLSLGAYYTQEISPHYDLSIGIKYYKKGFEKIYLIDSKKAADIATTISFSYEKFGMYDMRLEWLKKSYNIYKTGLVAYEIGTFYLYNLENPKYEFAFKKVGDWYQKSAQLGYANGLEEMGNAYSKGYFRRKIDMSRAIEYYKEAADKGSRSSLNRLKELGITYTPKKNK